MLAYAVTSTAKIGASRAAIGMVVGSVPVTIGDTKTLAIAAPHHATAVTTAKTDHAPTDSTIRRLTPAASSTMPVATAASGHTKNIASCRCSWFEPVIMSGE